MQTQAMATGSEPNPVDTTGLCLLSLDGGGVRGLSTLYILKNIMDDLNYERNEQGLRPVKPCEVFDLIGGTSTGGIIAIMLGRLEMTVDECITAYERLIKTVFKGKRATLPISRTGAIKARFSSDILKSAILEVLASRDVKEEDLLNDGDDSRCKVFVCAMAKETTKITRLRSYNLRKTPKTDATICQAALATSAATSFFDPVYIGDRCFVDGGLNANNPVIEVEGEASRIWCPQTGDLKSLVKCFISIGTGNPGKREIESKGLKFIYKTLVAITTETEQTASEISDRWVGHFRSDRYFRFNVEQGLQDVGLEEYKEKAKIEAATNEYVELQESRFRLDKCVENLVQKQNSTGLKFSETVDKHRSCLMQYKNSPHERFTNIPFPENEGFVGREKELGELKKLLFPSSQQSKVAPQSKVAITGLGGVGKTQIAIKLAYETQLEHPGCHVFWIPVTSLKSLERAYYEIARALGIPGVDEKEDDIKLLLKDYLTKSVAEWLLIFDNADDIDMWFGKPSMLSDYLPWSKRGRILFTTRYKKIAHKLAKKVIGVAEMDEEKAMELFRGCLDKTTLCQDYNETLLLLEKLTFLPLAIVQAASYINENSVARLSDYLSLLERREEEVVDLFSEEFEGDGRYLDGKSPVATTWLISFEQICKNPLAGAYLSFIACIEPTNIPKSLLPPARSRKEEIEAIGMLKAYWFVSEDSQKELLNLHRLVHLATRNWLRKADSTSTLSLTSCTSMALARLREVFPCGEYEEREKWRAYMPHVLSLIGRDEAQGSDRYALLGKLGGCLLADGRPKEAGVYIEKASGWISDQEAVSQLASQYEPTMSYRSTGQLKQTIDLFEYIIELTYLSGDNSYQVNEEVKQSMKELEHTVEIEKSLPQDDPDRLAFQYLLGVSYLSNAQNKQAIPLLEHVAKIRKSLPEDHPDRLASEYALGVLYQRSGKNKQAIKLLEHVVKTRKSLPEDHPRRLASEYALAISYKMNGQIKQEISLLEHVVEMRKSLRQDHPHRLPSEWQLAIAYRINGQIKKATKLEKQVTKMRKSLSEDHTYRLASE